MQGADTDDLSVTQGQQGEFAAQIDIGSPRGDDLALVDTMLDEHAFLFRYRLEKLPKRSLVRGLELAQMALKTFWELNFPGVILQDHVKHGQFLSHGKQAIRLRAVTKELFSQDQFDFVIYSGAFSTYPIEPDHR